MPTKTINDLTATADILDADELAFWNVANARTDKITYAEFKTDLLATTSSDTEILFNNAGVLDGDPRLTYNPATNVFSLQGDFNINGNNIINTGTLTLPTDTDTLVARNTTDILTNKTFDSTSNVWRTSGTTTLTALTTISRGTNNLDLDNLLITDSSITFSSNILSLNATGAALRNNASTATVATLIPKRSQLGTGIGGNGTFVSIISQGTGELARFDVTLVTLNANLEMGGNNIDLSQGNIVDVNDITADRVIIENLGAGASPILFSNKAAQELTLTGNLDLNGSLNMGGSAINSCGNIRFTTVASLRTNTASGNTVSFQARDTNLVGDITFATLTAGTVPTFEIFAPSGGTTTITTDSLTITNGGLLQVGSKADPDPSGTAGDIYYNTTSNTFRGFTTGWGDLGGDVTKVGTPVNDQVTVWTGDGTIEGTDELKFSGIQLTTNANNTGTVTNLVNNGDVVSGGAKFRASISTASTGDVYLEFAISTARVYSFGADNSDSDILKITTTTGTNVVTPSTGTTIISFAAGPNIGFFGVTPVAQPAHIVDADGTLADITTKFNTLLAQLAATGMQASS